MRIFRKLIEEMYIKIIIFKHYFKKSIYTTTKLILLYTDHRP
jgi:hypothetical protein